MRIKMYSSEKKSQLQVLEHQDCEILRIEDHIQACCFRILADFATDFRSTAVVDLCWHTCGPWMSS